MNRLKEKYRKLTPRQQLAFRVTSWVIVLSSLLLVYLIPLGGQRHHNSAAAELRALEGPVPPPPATDKEKIQTYDAIVSFVDAHQGAVALSALAAFIFLTQGLFSFLYWIAQALGRALWGFGRASSRHQGSIHG